MLRDDYGIKLPDWRLAKATGISDDGKTIVGYGYRPLDGNYVQAFRVTLPEPGGLLVLIPCASAALRRRRGGDA